MATSRKRPRLFNAGEGDDDGSDTFFVSSAAATRRPSQLGSSLPAPAPASAPASSLPAAFQVVTLDSMTPDRRRIVRETLPIPAPSTSGTFVECDTNSSATLPDMDARLPTLDGALDWSQFFCDDAENVIQDVSNDVEEHARRYLNSVSTFDHCGCYSRRPVVPHRGEPPEEAHLLV